MGRQQQTKKRKNFEVKTYPNPFSSSVELSMKSDENAKAELLVKNVLGQNIYSSVINLNKGENRIVWDGKSDSGFEVSPGNYLVTVKTPLKSTSVKIIKQ